jgi:uncharacterized protein YyaL (SSP411 family)
MNRLAGETSPYLRQHEHNPVDWMPWGPEVFARAKAEGKPVLLSSGYAACHWCHVMAHESFENPEIAALMNRLFVCVKLDREEHPAVDRLYQQALALLGQPGGWPLTMFLDAEGTPFWGGTYFPPESRYGRPGFPDVLRFVAAAHAEEGDKVRHNADALREGLRRLAEAAPGPALTDALAGEAGKRIAQLYDTVRGGLKGAPKFPQASFLSLLWRVHKRTGDRTCREAFLSALDNMCRGGIYDQIGGGFHRYAVDEDWLVPHFEKMLPDSAQLIALLTWAWQETGNPLYRDRIEGSAAWMLREMRLPGGGFAASLDADSPGGEGAFYTWTPGEIGDAAEAYGVTAEGNWEEGRSIPHRRHRRIGEVPEPPSSSRDALRRIRDQRPRPARDDKILTDWNALAIIGLARAGFVFRREDWVEAAGDCFDFLWKDSAAETGLVHVLTAGRRGPKAGLEDYAQLCLAALALHEATGVKLFITRAVFLAEAAERLFAAKDGGYHMVAEDAGLILRPRSGHDEAAPSGNAALLEAQARLWQITGNDVWRVRAEALSMAFSGEIASNPAPFAALISASELLRHPLLATVLGRKQAERHLNALREASLPGLILHRAARGVNKFVLDGAATTYICRGDGCSPPLTEADSVRRWLDSTSVP